MANHSGFIYDLSEDIRKLKGTCDNTKGCEHLLMKQYDVIVIGSGFAGAVSARRFADEGKRVLLLERRSHIAGNAYDFFDETSVLVHRYGPHIFHTNDEEVFAYLSNFTKWIEYEHRVVANIRGLHIPLPFNFSSLELIFGEKATLLQQKLKENFGDEKKISIFNLRESENKDVAELGDYVYENIYLHYSQKQWGEHFAQLDPGTFLRVPVLLSYDDRYFQDTWQGVPADGYTQMIQNMLDHELIELRLNTNGQDFLSLLEGKIFFKGEPYFRLVIYTGAIDELFGYRYGRLPYRTLDFSFETHKTEWYQDHSVINYTVDQQYTRITEYKHLTKQNLKSYTTISKEYSREFTGRDGEIPYYPISSESSSDLYQRYADIAKQYPNLHLLGRLAEYRYYNMETVVAQALKFSKH